MKLDEEVTLRKDLIRAWEILLEEREAIEAQLPPGFKQNTHHVLNLEKKVTEAEARLAKLEADPGKYTGLSTAEGEGKESLGPAGGVVSIPKKGGK